MLRHEKGHCRERGFLRLEFGGKPQQLAGVGRRLDAGDEDRIVVGDLGVASERARHPAPTAKRSATNITPTSQSAASASAIVVGSSGTPPCTGAGSEAAEAASLKVSSGICCGSAGSRMRIGEGTISARNGSANKA